MADFIVANFDGTGTLTGYTPDTGSAFTAPSMNNIPDGTFGHGLSNTAMLAYLTRVSAGSFKQIIANPWGDDYFLYNPTVPPSPDYYLESVLLLDPAATINAYLSHCHRIILGTGGDTGYFDCVTVRFGVDETDHTHRRIGGCFAECQLDTSGAPFASIVNSVNVVSQPIALGAAASVKLRSEIEGFLIRAFADDVLIFTADLSDGTSYFSGAGKTGWSFQFESSGTYSASAYDSLKAGTDFIPPPPGDFWQDFIKTVET